MGREFGGQACSFESCAPEAVNRPALESFPVAEGGDDEVRIAFASHDVIVRGVGVGLLLHDLADQGVTGLQEPTRLDRFAYIEPFVREVIVNTIDLDQC